jgi:hypothetical protein
MTAVMLAVALGFSVMGTLALARPTLIATQFGTGAETADARTEIRAVYGGFGIAMAVLLTVAALQPRAEHHRNGVALTIGVALAGMALGRAIGIMRERPRGLYPTVVFLVIELGAALALLVARI